MSSSKVANKLDDDFNLIMLSLIDIASTIFSQYNLEIKHNKVKSISESLQNGGVPVKRIQIIQILIILISLFRFEAQSISLGQSTFKVAQTISNKDKKLIIKKTFFDVSKFHIEPKNEKFRIFMDLIRSTDDYRNIKNLTLDKFRNMMPINRFKTCVKVLKFINGLSTIFIAKESIAFQIVSKTSNILSTGDYMIDVGNTLNALYQDLIDNQADIVYLEMTTPGGGQYKKSKKTKKRGAYNKKSGSIKKRL